MDNRLTIPLIQAARGIAVVLVMLFHTSQLAQKYFHINFLAVSGMDRSGGYAYFFVLTGFLMFTLYHRHFGKAHMGHLYAQKAAAYLSALLAGQCRSHSDLFSRSCVW